jgi:3-phenylpropionate/trans-cinnamate dioxygenase ferredoxin component
MSEPEYTALAKLADIPAGKLAKVEAGGWSILLCHTEGGIYAVENRCSHAEEPLECGRMRHGWISCPAHGSRFDLATGCAMNPPATDPIRTFPVRIEGDTVLVAL